MGKKKVVLDTNVLISAFGWNGNARIAFRKILIGEYELIISKSQINEIRRVLDYDKFDFSINEKARFLAILLKISIIVDVKSEMRIVKDDPSDDVIVLSALENGVEFIVTGDEDLLRLKNLENVKIVTISQFLEF